MGREGDPYGPPRDDRRLERLVSAGRQLVDGVAGTRPGARLSSRAASQPAGRSAARPRLDSLGRWVENKLDWLLEDGDDWREPWQEPGRDARRPMREEAEAPRPAAGRGRQPLEAISRRGSCRERPSPGLNNAGPARPDAAASDDAWPDDTAFTVPRWQRGATPPPQPSPESEEPPPPSQGRALPRSSRRR